MQGNATNATAAKNAKDKAKRIRLTTADFKRLPREYQLRVLGAVDLMKLMQKPA